MLSGLGNPQHDQHNCRGVYITLEVREGGGVDIRRLHSGTDSLSKLSPYFMSCVGYD